MGRAAWLGLFLGAACGRVAREDADSDSDSDSDTGSGDADVDSDSDSDTGDCATPDCFTDGVCISTGGCSDFGFICEDGAIRGSCGDGSCGCSENDPNQGLDCADDCPPSWQPICYTSANVATCDEHCANEGMRCNDLCPTAGGSGTSGAEIFTDGTCTTNGAYLGCFDPIPIGQGAFCCCAPLG